MNIQIINFTESNKLKDKLKDKLKNLSIPSSLYYNNNTTKINTTTLNTVLNNFKCIDNECCIDEKLYNNLIYNLKPNKCESKKYNKNLTRRKSKKIKTYNKTYKGNKK